MFLLAICPEAIAAATYAWNPHPMWLLLTIYIFFFYLLTEGKKKYHFVPGKEKSGTFYLLIEPDHEKPWSYEGWLETVIKSGKILSTVELPSGLIVQKRMH